MTDQELAEMAIEDRNRILDAWVEEAEEDLEPSLWSPPIYGWAWSEKANQDYGFRP